MNNGYFKRKQLYMALPAAVPVKGGNYKHRVEFLQLILKYSINNLKIKSALI